MVCYTETTRASQPPEEPAWGPMVVVHQQTATLGEAICRLLSAHALLMNITTLLRMRRRHSGRIAPSLRLHPPALIHRHLQLTRCRLSIHMPFPVLQALPQCKMLPALTIVTHTPRRHMVMWKVALVSNSSAALVHLSHNYSAHPSAATCGV